jgi:hypothetical protein
MAKRRGDWVGFSRRLVAALKASNDDRPEITMTIEEIKDETGTTMTVDDLRDRSYWKSCRTGAKYFDTHTKAGLALQEHLDGGGRVVSVTYWLAEAHAMA